VPRRDLTRSAVDDVRYIVGIYDKDAGPDNQRAGGGVVVCLTG
jgi:hypothetical protein